MVFRYKVSTMSRSRKHTPIGAITTATSEKRDKQLANRRLRAALRSAVALGADVLPEMRDVSDPWTFDKDGKRWWGAAFPRSLRK
jgi:hypothetical protein